MKKILIIGSLAVLALACQKEPYLAEQDGEYLVYTSPDSGVVFSNFTTYHIPDSVLVVGQDDKPVYSTSDKAMELVELFKSNLNALGYVYTDNVKEADMGVQLTYLIKTERYVHLYDNPYWWLYLPGYWPYYFWGDWFGWYNPHPVRYTLTTNALVGEFVDLLPAAEASDTSEVPLRIVWSTYIGGPATTSLDYNMSEMKDAVNQAFAQSPYLSRTSK